MEEHETRRNHPRMDETSTIDQLQDLSIALAEVRGEGWALSD
jgi:hypothetical protein